jgi:BMFP domain-containing protein YqiC
MQFNNRVLDELAARIGKAVEASPVRDIEKNVKALLQSGLMRLDLVTRQEFDTQAQVLLRTREKLEALEARLAQMEARAGSSAAGEGAGEGAGGMAAGGAGAAPSGFIDAGSTTPPFIGRAE